MLCLATYEGSVEEDRRIREYYVARLARLPIFMGCFLFYDIRRKSHTPALKTPPESVLARSHAARERVFVIVMFHGGNHAPQALKTPPEPGLATSHAVTVR